MRKRNVHVQFWLDKKEAEAFNKKVKRSGLSREVYLRHLINGLVPQDAPPPAYFDFIRELHGIGSEDFYREHKTICFDTLDSFGEYEVIAAFKTVAYSGEGFKYYHFVNAESAEAFDEYIAECKALALYDTGVTAEYGDKLITLSTCEYSRTNGRMVVVAKLLDA